MFKRPVYGVIAKRLQEKRRFIQVLSGPRQTGKTTLALQLIDDISAPTHYTSADEPALKSTAWIDEQWETARFKIRQGGLPNGGLLVLDEIHKIPGWSETVKRLWDEDTVQGSPLHVILLGSSPILMQSGLTESLAGRFEVIPVSHWSFVEMKKAFGWGIDRYVYFGGYPGAAELTGDQARWSRYIMDALIETTVSRDVLLMKRVDKPALLRRLFELGCIYSGQILSYQKMLGQLHDAGNTTTLAHYLDLLGSAGLLRGLSKYAGETVRQRGSSPKFQVYNNALMTAQSPLTFETAKEDSEFWGRLTESAIGASLLNGIEGTGASLFYWLDRNHEVDFVLHRGNTLVAIEVKSGRTKTALPGIESFARSFEVKRKLLVGPQGIPVEDFMSTSVEDWLS
jgi:predicted AAA+ superfamily ATPase